MARIETSGIAELQLSFSEIAELPSSVANEMLEVGAEIVKNKQQELANSMLIGPYHTGETAQKIKIGKPKRSKDGYSIGVYPDGTRKRGQRAAEVAFINEFGKKGQPARPFIRTANELSADNAVEAEAAVYDKFINK